MIKHPKNKIIILGIDTLSPKNKYQLKAAIGLGFEIEVFTNDKLNNSNDNIFTPHKLNKLKKSPIKRFFQVFKFVSKNKGSIHHIEIYPGGRYSYIYLFSRTLLLDTCVNLLMLVSVAVQFSNE